MGFAMRRVVIAVTALIVVLLALPALASAARAKPADERLDRGMRNLVHSEGGPAGAISIVQRGNDREVHAAGVANIKRGTRLRAVAHMRIASVAKAFSGAVALSLVDQGVMSLDDTIGQRLPDTPAQWHDITLAQLLQHRSGLREFTKSKRFEKDLGESLKRGPAPEVLLGYTPKRLRFPPGTDYRYSNSDNIAVGLMVQQATGTSYERNLKAKVFGPVGIRQTLMPSGVPLDDPFISGYQRDADTGKLEDVSQLVDFGGWAWASGGIESTPGNMNRFVRAYVGGKLFGAAVQRKQRRWVEGSSDPPGPGVTSAGLALFRYRTRCGTVYGHTGSVLGYTQFIAATPSGRRSVTFMMNEQFTEDTLSLLRRTETKAVCAALAKR